MFGQKFLLVLKTILIFLYFHSIDCFFEKVSDKTKDNEPKRAIVVNKTEEVLDGMEWKTVDREIVKFGIRSELKNFADKKMIIKNEIFEKMEIQESKDLFGNRRSDRTARTGRMNLMVDKSLRLSRQLNVTSDDKPKVLVQILQRIRRKAQNKISKEDKKKKKDNKDQSFTDSIMEMASQTLKDGLRKGVKLWNQIKNQISDSFNSLVSNE